MLDQIHARIVLSVTWSMVKIGNPPDNFGLCKKAIAPGYRVDIDQPAKHAMKFTAQTRLTFYRAQEKTGVARGACCFGSLCAQIVIVKGNPGFAGQID